MRQGGGATGGRRRRQAATLAAGGGTTRPAAAARSRSPCCWGRASSAWPAWREGAGRAQASFWGRHSQHAQRQQLGGLTTAARAPSEHAAQRWGSASAWQQCIAWGWRRRRARRAPLSPAWPDCRSHCVLRPDTGDGSNHSPQAAPRRPSHTSGCQPSVRLARAAPRSRGPATAPGAATAAGSRRRRRGSDLHRLALADATAPNAPPPLARPLEMNAPRSQRQRLVAGLLVFVALNRILISSHHSRRTTRLPAVR